ncbi:uncharacterized protein PADG_02610 [Paracoccidioides brasiliensis Pb18]|uniref:Uncharacterized protein n=1 Tax=Paracoccidioides brasiliensis (strain Pb18) TaxID=502780 RepID=C1G605_PARBD|nr:uncharacterized protein PADG_02610 [Paracoccidioides brasiliensis Pb18]EEH46512.2 hypothetical protein PADG_02610 [Paracoccidioides brasiliensis Pb18]ODH52148.1 hypothetical protein GX48_01702 [Paracoccidioides brasiliensis]
MHSPSEPFSLHGGCHCAAVRYIITFPGYEQRPVLNPNHPPGQPDIKAPLLCFDHCSDCRSASGVPVQIWNICPQEFITFSLLRRSNDSSFDAVGVEEDGAKIILTGDQLVYPNEVTKDTYLTHYASSKSVWRTFCSRCGTNISFVAFEEEGSETLMDIGVGTLDRSSIDLVGTPHRHIWWNSGIDWVKKLIAEGDGTASNHAIPKHPGGNIYEIL